MKGVFQLDDPGQAEFTLVLTATLDEWLAIRHGLELDSIAAVELASVIRNLSSQAQRQFVSKD